MGAFFYLSCAEVGEEAAFHQDGLLLELFIQNNEDDNHCSDTEEETDSQIDVAAQGNHHQSDTKQDTDNDERDERPTVELIVLPELLELDGVVLLHHNGAEHRRDEGEDDDECEDISLPARKLTENQRGDELHPGEDEDKGHGSISPDDAEQGFQQLIPSAFLPDGIEARGVMIQELLPGIWESPLNNLDARVGGLNHIWREKRGNDGDRNHDGIEEIVRNLQRLP